MTDPTPLSPAAQAVMDAVVGGAHPAFAPIAAPLAAVALRAAADQVVPREPTPDVAALEKYERWDAKRWVRLQLLAIAAELDNHNHGDDR